MRRNRIIERVPVEELDNVRFSQEERLAILKLYESGGIRERRLAFDYLWTGGGVRQNRKFIFEMCDRMIPDRSSYVRWQSLLLLGDYAETHPKQLWPIILKWGCDRRPDVRGGVACCVLEVVLEHHFDPYFEKSIDFINRGHRRFASTLSGCWISERAIPPHLWERFEECRQNGVAPSCFG